MEDDNKNSRITQSTTNNDDNSSHSRPNVNLAPVTIDNGTYNVKLIYNTSEEENDKLKQELSKHENIINAEPYNLPFGDFCWRLSNNEENFIYPLIVQKIPRSAFLNIDQVEKQIRRIKN